VNPAASCASALAILGDSGSSLVSAMEAVLGRRPRLQVLSVSRCSAPDWSVPPLSPDADVLLRWTAYRLGSVDLSRHVAAVDLSVLDPASTSFLQKGSVGLAKVLEDPRVNKMEARVGLLHKWGILDQQLRRSFEESGTEGQSASRQYVFTMDGVPAGVVVEVLPCELWRRLTQSGHPESASRRT
jgi:hypothetical protein